MTDHHVFKAARLSPDVIRLMATVFDEWPASAGLPVAMTPSASWLQKLFSSALVAGVATPPQGSGAHMRRSALRKRQQHRPLGRTIRGRRNSELSGNHCALDVLMLSPLRHPPSPRARSGR